MGIVSALEQRLPTETGCEVSSVIQKDTAINSGNLRRPLIVITGRLISVNTAIYSGSGSSSGIGFAIPVEVVNKIVPEVIARCTASRPGIGISATQQGFAVRMGIDGVVFSPFSDEWQLSNNTSINYLLTTGKSQNAQPDRLV